ncbi:tyrosine-type recombinase/integrase, partial [uncultured Paraglaciecola sp.]|uniref:tyrosine-type recombinase/integrase n=1 Tax=uncultured Paraglaciecola sp. TaxID=1765024 RepID=UPI00344B372B
IKNALYQEELSCTKIKGFHLKKTKTGGTWRLRYSDLAKKRKVITLGRFIDGTKDRIEAFDLAVKYRGNIKVGGDPLSEVEKELQQRQIKHAENLSSTVGSYFYGAYTLHQEDKLDDGKHNLGFIKRYFSDWFDRPMSDINKQHLKSWQLGMKSKGLSHATIQRSFGALRTMLRHAVEEEVLDVDPTANFKLAPPTAAEKLAKNDGSDKKKRRMLTDEELAGINKGANLFNAECIEKLNKPNWNRPIPVWFYPFFRLAAYSGFRTGDLYSLNWNELNLQFRRLIKTPRKTLHHNDPITVDLPLDDGITKVLNDWHTFLGKPTSGLVFPNMQTGQQMDKKTHGKHWKKVLRLGGVKTEIDFYSLRHHYCSKMASSGVPLFEIAKLAGHKSTKMIADHYGHLSANAGKNALAFVSGDFDSPFDTVGDAVNA